MLARSYEKDKRQIATAVRGMPSENCSWLVAFPEGTRVRPLLHPRRRLLSVFC